MSNSRRAIVLGATRTRMNLLTESGQFITVASQPGARVGDRVHLSSGQRSVDMRSVAVAALVVSAIIVAVCLRPSVVAYVTVDINPSLELAVARSGRVQSVRPINFEGGLIKRHSDLSGLALEVAVARVIDSAASLDLSGCEPLVLVTVVPAPGAIGPVDDHMLTELIRAVSLGIQDRGSRPATGVVAVAGVDVRRRAGLQGLSTGRYLTMLAARDAGVEVCANQLAGPGWCEAMECYLDQVLRSLTRDGAVVVGAGSDSHSQISLAGDGEVSAPESDYELVCTGAGRSAPGEWTDVCDDNPLCSLPTPGDADPELKQVGEHRLPASADSDPDEVAKPEPALTEAVQTDSLPEVDPDDFGEDGLPQPVSADPVCHHHPEDSDSEDRIPLELDDDEEDRDDSDTGQTGKDAPGAGRPVESDPVIPRQRTDQGDQAAPSPP